MGTIDPQAIKPDGVFTTTCWECSAYCGALARAISIVPSQCFDMQFSVSRAYTLREEKRLNLRVPLQGRDRR